MADTLSGTATLSFEQVTERHDPSPHDKDVQPIDLPGVVNVYLHLGDAKLLFTQYKAGKVYDALEQAQAAKASQQTTPTTTTTPPQEQQAPPERQAPPEQTPPPAQV